MNYISFPNKLWLDPYFFGFLLSASSLKCHHKGHNSGDESKVIDCPPEFDSPRCMNASGERRVTRACVPKEIMAMSGFSGDSGCMKITYNGKQVITCYCSTDACNVPAADGLYSTVGTATEALHATACTAPNAGSIIQIPNVIQLTISILTMIIFSPILRLLFL